ncbi:MAG: hypothetical protein HC867_03490 [Bacteroidia bacterium]|nr:hypothetical protein [Bacteroidia bacterium]
MLVDQQQRFAVEADTVSILQNTRFINSADNDLFKEYQKLSLRKAAPWLPCRKNSAGQNYRRLGINPLTNQYSQ